MLSPRTRAQWPLPTNSRPMMKAWARPSGFGCAASVANIDLFVRQADQVMTGRGGHLDQMASNLAASAEHHDPRSHGNAFVKRAPSLREAPRRAVAPPSHRKCFAGEERDPQLPQNKGQ